MISALGETAVRDETEIISVSLKLRTDDSFQIGYGDADALQDEAPKATHLLAASIAMCLAASLQHCLRKGRVPITELEASAVVTVERNESGRLRVKRVNVLLDPTVGLDFAGRLERCTTLFEDYCTVTESVRQGIDVRVTVATN
jgi:uncharacterized OsmC-like protein